MSCELKYLRIFFVIFAILFSFNIFGLTLINDREVKEICATSTLRQYTIVTMVLWVYTWIIIVIKSFHVNNNMDILKWPLELSIYAFLTTIVVWGLVEFVFNVKCTSQLKNTDLYISSVILFIFSVIYFIFINVMYFKNKQSEIIRVRLRINLDDSYDRIDDRL